MTDFKYYQSYIKSLGGIWASNDVYFAQMRDMYTAAYLPRYPERSDKDEIKTLTIFNRTKK